MSADHNKTIAIKWFDAFNRKDIELLLNLYNDHAQHYSPKLKLKMPETEGLIKGKVELRNWWTDAFERIPDLKYELKRLVADSDSVFMEYTRYAKNDEPLQVAEVLDISGGLIQFSRVYHG